MRLTYIFILLFFACNCGAVAQTTPDTLIFTNQAENENIQKVLNKSKFDTFALYYLAGNADTTGFAQHRVYLENFVSNQRKKYGTFRKPKYVKKLLENVHAYFLKQYELNVPFYRIFQDGHYNCLTSCALYVLVFDKLGIPYQLKELPTHIYLTVKIGDKFEDIETTIPADLQHIKKSDKEKYVNDLVANKIVSQKELEEKGIPKVFDEHFYESTDIDIVQMCGLAYNNLAADFTDSSRFFKALDQLLISRNLYRRNEVNLFAGSILNMLGNNTSKYGQFEVMKYAIIFSDLTDNDILAQALIYFGNNTLFRKNEADSFLLIYPYLTSNIIRNDEKYFRIRETYHKLLGEYYFLTKKYLLSAQNYRESYVYNPWDIQAPNQTKISLINLFNQLFDSIEYINKGNLTEVFSFSFIETDKQYTTALFEFIYKSFQKNFMEDVWEKNKLDTLSFLVMNKTESLGKLRLMPEQLQQIYFSIMRNYLIKRNFEGANVVIQAAKLAVPFDKEFANLSDMLQVPSQREILYNGLVELYHSQKNTQQTPF
ncbi:MAG: hypothetical protein KG003_09875 [Bacteroidetes bacterium]|nr:hypothetical protein [Bacteroidota bacterium]